MDIEKEEKRMKTGSSFNQDSRRKGFAREWIRLGARGAGVAVALGLSLLTTGGLSAMDGAATPAQLTPDQQVAALESMCNEAQDAMKARQAAKPLYDRLGGRESIHAVVHDVVQRHLKNDAIDHLMEGVDTDHLVNQVTDFLSAATGGDVTYSGRDMASAHAHLELTNADFLAAGGDVEAALVAAGVGQNEIQEVMCAFVSLRGEVVTR
jgi:hemoglobin